MSGIRFENVTKEYPNGVRALDQVSFEIEDGEFVVLVGPSGCGKSTLLRSVAGLERVTDGHIFIGEREVTHLSPRDRDIAMVFQSYALYPHMSVEDNIAFGLRLRRAPREQVRGRAADVGRILGLTELFDRRPSQLSGGQRQRVAMGRAIAREPAAYLMDEPLSNLDAKLRVAMRAELVELHQRLGVTTVFVTHDQVEAMTLGQRVAILSDGRLLQFGSPRELFNRPANLFVASFIGSPAMNFVEARLDERGLRFGGHVLELDDAARPAADGGRFILGVRPHAFDLTAREERGQPTLTVTATVVEELGAETFVHFDLEAGGAPDARATADEDGALLLADSRARFVARVDGRHEVRTGDRLELTVDPRSLYYFDPRTHVRVPARAEAALDDRVEAGI